MTNANAKATVLRHTWAVRLAHWTIAISGIVLLFSGFGQLPMYKRYNVVKIPGLEWSGDYAITYTMHMGAAFFFGAAILFHIIYHASRKEFIALPKKGDIKESIQIIKAMLTGKQEPPHAQFLAEQRLVYAVMGSVSLLLLLTGLVKVYKNMGAITLDPTFIAVITLIHTALTPVFLLLLFAHLGAFLIKENRPLFGSMFTGRVDKEYADHRHPLWNYPGKMQPAPSAAHAEAAPAAPPAAPRAEEPAPSSTAAPPPRNGSQKQTEQKQPVPSSQSQQEGA
jgi:cytochrome b subunit of formate dehydrogenase